MWKVCGGGTLREFGARSGFAKIERKKMNFKGKMAQTLHLVLWKDKFSSNIEPLLVTVSFSKWSGLALELLLLLVKTFWYFWQTFQRSNSKWSSFDLWLTLKFSKGSLGHLKLYSISERGRLIRLICYVKLHEKHHQISDW